MKKPGEAGARNGSLMTRRALLKNAAADAAAATGASWMAREAGAEPAPAAAASPAIRYSSPGAAAWSPRPTIFLPSDK